MIVNRRPFTCAEKCKQLDLIVNGGTVYICREMNRGGLAMPRKAPDALKSCNMNFRVTGKLKAALQKAADANNRSLSQEMAHRMELSFVYEQTIGDVRRYEKERKRAVDIQTGAAPPPGRFITEQELKAELAELRRSIAASLAPKNDEAA